MRLIDIITIRKNKFNKDRENPSFTDFWQGYHEGWYNAYKDLEEILEQKGFDAVPVKRGTWKLNKDGSGTCDQCHFTQKAVWDFDRWQNFCGVCGADMRERKDGEG